jgi:hypothetical protein
MRPKSLVAPDFIPQLTYDASLPLASAFVRFATIEEANYAILNVNGYPFPGECRVRLFSNVKGARAIQAPQDRFL